MSFQITSASSSRITKSRTRNTGLKRSSGSPIISSRKKTTHSSIAKKKADILDDEEEDLFSSQLDDQGLVTALATDLNLRDVPQQLRYAQEHMFDEIPEGGGFNSTRISEILNFRRNLPPVVTSAHVHSLSRSPTATEREISELVGKGVIRKIIIPGRGLGRNNIGECLVLTDAWVAFVGQISTLEDSIKSKYINVLRDRPGQSGVGASIFQVEDVATLIKVGFLTASSGAAGALKTFKLDPSSTGTAISLSSAGSRAAAGSLQAVGGASAFMDAGGGGSALSGSSSRSQLEYGPYLNFSLPSMGPYLRLLESARSHLVSLLSKSRYREAPLSLLRERWDGAPAIKEKSTRTKSLDPIVLPAKTKKWKQFHGLKFQWVLEECLGTGLVEVFETGSVGQGVRLT